MRNLIISRPDRVGDVVISTSCLAPIREKFCDAKIFFVAAERMRPLLENHPLVAGFLPLEADLVLEFHRLEAEAIVHLQPHQDCQLAAQRAGVPVRIGYRVPFIGRQLTHAIEDRRAEGLRHEAEYNCDLLQPLGIMPPAKLSAKVHLPETSLRSLQRKLPWPLESTPFAVLNPSAHSKIARWPVDRFLQVADVLKKEFDLLPVFVGADASDSIPSFAGGHLNLAGKTDLGELGWLLKHARVVITNDSGPGHLAAAVGSPVVVIFGRTAPRYGPTRWRPLSDEAVVVSRPLPGKRFEGRDAYWKRCFAAIAVEEVEATARKALSWRAKTPFRNCTNEISV